MSQINQNRFTTYVWSVLAVMLLVILWGAVVRATGSGAGCGDHWPLCNGQVIPQSETTATFIEFFHRVTSGIALLLVIGMVVVAHRVFSSGHAARRWSAASLVFIGIESLIGALIVVQELTAQNDSVARALIIAVHQTNTLLLLGAITLTGWFASALDAPNGALPKRRSLTVGFVVGAIGLGLIGATGAITALGDTLFPAASLAEGWAAKFAPGAHFLVQLRAVHPIVAVLTGVYIVALAWWVSRQPSVNPLSKWLTSSLSALFLAQCALGGINVVLLAPVWVQLAHLLMADLVWIGFVLLAASSLFTPRTLAMTAQSPFPLQSKIQNQKS
jgi:heme A synthase